MMLGTVETACQMNDEYSDAGVSSDYDNAVGPNVYILGSNFILNFKSEGLLSSLRILKTKGHNNSE